MAVGSATTLAVAGGIKASGLWEKMLGGGALAVAGEVLFLVAMAAAAAMRNQSAQAVDSGLPGEGADGAAAGSSQEAKSEESEK